MATGLDDGDEDVGGAKGLDKGDESGVPGHSQHVFGVAVYRCDVDFLRWELGIGLRSCAYGCWYCCGYEESVEEDEEGDGQE